MTDWDRWDTEVRCIHHSVTERDRLCEMSGLASGSRREACLAFVLLAPDILDLDRGCILRLIALGNQLGLDLLLLKLQFLLVTCS
jgi:hypothetical protein